MKTFSKMLLGIFLLALLSACGGGGDGGGGGTPPPSDYAIGGTVSGLVSGRSVVLQNNGGNNLTVNANGGFTFSAPIASGAAYDVTVLTQPVGQVCTVANGSGTVGSANITNVNISCVANTYTIGGTVSGLAADRNVELQNNGDNNLTVNANGGFTFSAPIASGAAYDVTVFTQPVGQACSVTNGAGTVVGANITNVAVSCADLYARFAYVTGGFDRSQSISIYSFDTATEQLRPRGYVPTGYNAKNIALHPSGRYAYVTSALTDPARPGIVSQYAVGSDGMLTALNPGSVATGASPTNISIHPNGRWAYVASGPPSSPGLISQYSVAADGTLAPLMPSAITTGNGPPRVVIHPSGRYAYAVDFTAANIMQYEIGSDGVLAALEVAVPATEIFPNMIAFDPTGDFAYVVHTMAFDPVVIAQYAVRPDGALVRLAAAPSVDTNGTSLAIAVHGNGRYVYVPNYDAGTISQYTIGANGGLVPMNPATVPAGGGPASVIVDPSGRYVFVTMRDASVSRYAIGSDGGLAPTPVSQNVMTRGGLSIVMTQGDRPVTDTPKAAYVANANSGVASQYTIGANGVLGPKTPPSVTAGAGPYAITVDPFGRYAYIAAAGSASVFQYTIAADGALTEPATVADTQLSPYSVSVDPSGRFAYVANYFSNTVSQYTVRSNGALDPMADPNSTIATGNRPRGIAIGPTGSFAYVVYDGTGTSDPAGVAQYEILPNGSLFALTPPRVTVAARSISVHPSGQYAYAAGFLVNGSGRVFQFTIGSDGLLAAMTTVAARPGTTAVTVDPTGRYVYAANETDNSVSQYLVGSNGALAPMTPPAVPAGTGPVSITVDASGKFVYVTNAAGSTVSQYAVGAGGALSPLDPAAVTAADLNNPRSIATTATVQ